MAKFKYGDQIVFGRCKSNKDLDPDVTVGKIYDVVIDDSGHCFFYDNIGDRNYAGMAHPYLISNYKATKIIY